MKPLVFAVLVLTFGSACGPKRTKTAVDARAGDIIEWKGAVGQSTSAKIKFTVEQDIAQSGKPARRVALEFEGEEEESVSSQIPEGGFLMTARLTDIAGRATAGADQKMVDQFALALDELKIQFKRTARVETENLSILGVRSPLDDDTARSIVRSVFAAGRGPILPEGPVPTGGTWKVETPVANTIGFEGKVTYAYTLQKKEGTVAVISSEGKVDGQSTRGPAKKLTGTSTAEFRFDVAAGRMVSSVIDSSTEVQEGAGGAGVGVKQRIRLEWSRKDAATAK